jgi:hypothetical protein
MGHRFNACEMFFSSIASDYFKEMAATGDFLLLIVRKRL